MRTFVKALMLVLIVMSAAVAIAQTTQEVKLEGTVVAVYGDKLVVKMADGTVKEFTPAADRKFDVDGKQLTLAELQPGTKLSATITTTSTPVKVHTTKIKNGEVVKVVGSQLWVKMEDGKIKSFTVPAGFKFIVDGKSVGISDLQAKSKLSAEIVYVSEKTETTQAVKVAGEAPAPAPEPAAAAPAAEPAPAMPKTASDMPLVGLLGLTLLAAGIAVRRA